MVVGPYTAATGINITYNDKQVSELFVKVGEEFKLTATPLPADATISGAHWNPEEGKTDILAVNYRAGYELFDDEFAAKALTFKGLKIGNIVITAEIELEDGTIAYDTITVRVVPDNFIPYTVSVVNRGAEVPEGGSFVPQLALHARVEMLTEHRASKFEAEDLTVDSLRAQLQSDTIKKQLRDRLTWALVDPIPQLGVPPYTESTNKASINTKTGEITLKDAAVAGNVIKFVGILDDPYLGRITIPGSFTVVAAPEPEPHTCDYEGYAVISGNLTAHYRVCECGKKKTETHSFTEFTTETAGQIVSKYVCPCGVSYSQTVDAPVYIHVHTLEYVYDNHDHWQICTDEDCPDEYSTEHQGHSFELQTDDEGNEGYVCRVCKYCATEPLATLSGTVTSFGKATDNVTLQLIAEGYPEADYEVVVKGNSATYSIEGVAAGTYTLRIMKANHVTREYTVVVDSTSVVQDAKIHLLGDVTGDGRLRSNDLSLVYDHVSGETLIEDAYIFACADIDGNGRIRSNDITKMYDHTAGDELLW